MALLTLLNVHILGFINKLHQDPIIDIEEDHAPGGWGAWAVVSEAR